MPTEKSYRHQARIFGQAKTYMVPPLPRVGAVAIDHGRSCNLQWKNGREIEIENELANMVE